MLRKFVDKLPQYDYLYLGDNARTPYGTRSFETVYNYTRQCVQWLLQQGCPLVILACNTASAKALRTIQQNDLQQMSPGARVLGVIRPTTEVIGNYSSSNHIGILATTGTVLSESYLLEIKKFFPHLHVVQEACPMWVPLVENGEQSGAGADYFIKKHIENIIASSPRIDTLLLACTHYPLLINKIKQFLPAHVQLVSQADIVTESLNQYLKRHLQMESAISKSKQRLFYTTDAASTFEDKAALFFGSSVVAHHIGL